MEAADVDARTHFQVGQTLYEAGRFEQAGEEFLEAYRLSKRPQLLYNAYVAHRDANNFPKAIEALRAYLEADPDVPDRINLRARLKSMEDTVAQLKAAEAAEAARQEAAPEPEIAVRRSWVPTAMMAGGAGLVAASIGTGVATMKKTDDLDGVRFGGNCPASQDANVSRARGLAVATDVLLFTGLAAGVTGLVLRLTGALDEEYEVPVAMGCHARGCGLSFHGRF
jgi:tetratricopeptide (TPR) repeat protein